MDVQRETALAYVAFAAGQHLEAEERVRRVLAAAPGDPGALTLSARLALMAGEPEATQETLEALLRRFPGMAALWLDLALALRELGRHQEAAESAAKSASMEGGRNPAAWVTLGEILHSLDRRPEAADAFRRALALAPDHVGALRGLCLADDVAPGTDVAARMQRMVDGAALRPSDIAALHYSLAQVHRRAGDRPGFVRHLLAANAVQRSVCPKGRAEYAAIFDRLDATFTREALSRAARARAVEPTPVFILGMPRSGTTLVEQILSRHPEVAAGGELDYMRRSLRRAVERLTGQGFPSGFDSLPATALDGLAADFGRRLAIIEPGARYITDKTPGNYHVLGLLRVLFPQGRVIHLLRDPMDTCFSILQYRFDDLSPHTCDMELLAYVYARYRQMMDRWKELLGDEFLTVEYERLVEAPSDEARRVFAHCGLEWSDAYLDPASGGGAVRTFSAQQVRRPVYRTSVGAWREFSAELEPLRAALDTEFRRLGLPAMAG